MNKNFQRSSNHIFHLAIPTISINLAIEFYQKKLNFSIGRIHEDRVTFNVWDDQLVCHLVKLEEIDKEASFYPRHFGFTFSDRKEFYDFYKDISKFEDQIYIKLQKRWPGKIEEHDFFALRDPSSNFIEFKFYKDSKFIY